MNAIPSTSDSSTPAPTPSGSPKPVTRSTGRELTPPLHHTPALQPSEVLGLFRREPTGLPAWAQSLSQHSNAFLSAGVAGKVVGDIVRPSNFELSEKISMASIAGFAAWLVGTGCSTLQSRTQRTNELYQLENGDRAQAVSAKLTELIESQPPEIQRELMDELPRSWDELCEPFFQLCSNDPSEIEKGAKKLTEHRGLSEALGLDYAMSDDARSTAWDILETLGNHALSLRPELVVLSNDQYRRASEQFRELNRSELPPPSETYWRQSTHHSAGLGYPAFVATLALDRAGVPPEAYARNLPAAVCEAANAI